MDMASELNTNTKDDQINVIACQSEPKKSNNYDSVKIVLYNFEL